MSQKERVRENERRKNQTSIVIELYLASSLYHHHHQIELYDNNINTEYVCYI